MELVVTSLALDYIVAATAPGAIVAFAGLQHVVPGKLAGNTGRIPVADQLASTVLSLPIGPHMESADLEQVIRAVREFE